MIKFLLIALLSSFLVFTASASDNTIPAGTTLKARMAEPIDSRMRGNGYRFKVTIDSDVTVADKVVIKSGSKALAVINKIKSSGKGQSEPEIIMTLTTLTASNRQINVETFPIAGKGTTSERKMTGEIDENEYVVISQQGEKITASIAVTTRGYDILVTEGTILYFILKTPIVL